MKKTKLVIGCVLAAFLLNMALFGSLIASGTSLHDQGTEVEMGDYIYSSFFGGTNEDVAWSVAVDSQANIILAGSTYSTDFPVLNAYQDTYGGGDRPNDYVPSGFGGDGFVAKFDPAGQLTWSTFLGGTRMDCVRRVTVDASDNIIVLGPTNSTDYPVTDDAYQPAYAGGFADLFITKFAPDGTLTYSSYFGGSGQDLPNDLVLDLSGNLIITGRTESTDFPLTADAADSEIGGGSDAILVKFAPDCKTLLYSTYFGGSAYESGIDFAIDNQGNVILTGSTTSPDLPITDDAYQDTISGTERDFFVAKFSTDYQLSYATYFGGSQAEDCYGLVVDSAGNIILTGRTWSADFPTENAYQEEYTGLHNTPSSDHGEIDGFIVKLSADGQDLVFSTYLGDVSWDTVFNPVIDRDDNIIVTFLTDFYDFPVIDGLPLNAVARGSGNFLVIKMSPTGDLLFSSYLGGSFYDHPHDQVIVDGTIYIAGQTDSYNFLITGDAYQEHYLGGMDGFIFRLELSDYLDDLDAAGSSTNGTTGTANSTPGFELPLVLVGLISLLVMSRRSGRKHP